MAKQTEGSTGAKAEPRDVKASAKLAPKDAIIEALMELAGERTWEDITISDVATRANLTLADFRDAFPSKGAVLAALSRKIDRIVLDGTTDDLMGEPAKERLFDVLMRRLDAMAPYKLGLEGPVGAVKLQGLVLVWMRVLRTWLRDDDPGLAPTMALLDKELTRGGKIVSRVEDVNRLASPLFSLARAMFERRPDYPRETRRSWRKEDDLAGTGP